MLLYGHKCVVWPAAAVVVVDQSLSLSHTHSKESSIDVTLLQFSIAGT